ncbi:MAG: hypothetical protein AB1410_02165, partial [Acidobacteriota bacterium]
SIYQLLKHIRRCNVVSTGMPEYGSFSEYKHGYLSGELILGLLNARLKPCPTCNNILCVCYNSCI